MARPYKEVRKDYILKRVETMREVPVSGNWRRWQKERACFEFDEFVAEERRLAVERYKQDLLNLEE